MKTRLKYLLLFAFCASSFIGVYAQNVESEMIGSNVIASKFTRPSLSVATVKFSNSVAMSTEILANLIPVTFDKNASKSSPIMVNKSVVLPYYGDDEKEDRANNLAIHKNKAELDPLVLDAVKKSRIANEILDNLFIVNGQASLDNLIARAIMTKTDKEVNTESEMTLEDQFARDFATVKEQLNLIYIVVFSAYDLTPYETDDAVGFKSLGAYWLLKLEVPSDFESLASANWRNLRNFLGSASFNWSLIKTEIVTNYTYESKPKPRALTGDPVKDAKIKKQNDQAMARFESYRKSPEESFAIIQTKLFDNYIIETKEVIDDFRVRVPLLYTKPIRAKVGLKEGLSKGQRWVLLETVEKDGIPMQVHRGFVRADSIVDNRGIATGNTKPSTFYQIQGKKPEPGMLMVLQDDQGGLIRLAHMQKVMKSENYNPSFQSVQGIVIVKDVKGLIWSVELQIDDDKTVKDFIENLNLPDTDTNNYRSYFGIYGANIGYQFYTSRNSQLRVEGGYLFGVSDPDLSENYSDYGYWYQVLHGSASLNFNLGKSNQLNITAGYRGFQAFGSGGAENKYEATPFWGVGLTSNF